MKATSSESKASSRWEFDFQLGRPSKIRKNFDWEAMPCDEVPKVYRVNHVKRLTDKRNGNFEGQLPKLRYYHTVKKVEVPEVNNNSDAKSVKSQPITANSKKNGSTGQMKITGTILVGAFFCPKLTLFILFSADFLKEKKRLTVTTKKKH